MVRALTSHQFGSGSIPGLGVMCGLSSLLVLAFAPRNFSPRTLVFPSPQKPTFPNSNSYSLSRASGSRDCTSTPRVIDIKYSTFTLLFYLTTSAAQGGLLCKVLILLSLSSFTVRSFASKYSQSVSHRRGMRFHPTHVLPFAGLQSILGFVKT